MKKIVIIFHKNDKNRLQNYLIMRLTEIWRSEGIEVIPVLGIKRFVPADLAILHVDLSVVPDEYINFAQKYPIALNRAVKDVRKSTFIDNTIKPGDKYEGKIIVKSNLNCAGVPERRNSSMNALFSSLKRRLDLSEILGGMHKPYFNTPSDYIILESSSCVPENWFKNKDIVIQKFLPEMDNGCYCIRNYFFLGNRSTSLLRKGNGPIVNSGSTSSLEPIDVHPDIVKLRSKLRFDYGKFDYIVHEGVPMLIDINKTTGTSPTPYLPMRSNLAAGIYSYIY